MTRSSDLPNHTRAGQSPSSPLVETLEQRQLLSAAVGAVIDSLHDELGSATTNGTTALVSESESYETVVSNGLASDPTTTTVTSSAPSSTSIYGSSVTFTATVTGTVPTGTVTFFDGATSLGVGTAGAPGTWTFTTAAFHAGSHNITAVYGGDTLNDGSTSGILVATVTAKPLTVTGITAANKVYDATAAATLTTTAATLTGVIAGDTANVTLVKTAATGTFANANAGAGKTVTVAGLTLSGSAASDYTLTQPTTTADITAKALTVTGTTAANKVYDGATTATLTTTASILAGVVAADTANVALVKTNAAGVFGNTAVGTAKPVTISGFTLSGSAAANYTLAQPSTTANITARAITLTGVTAANKVYDGTTTATLDFSGAVVNGILASDNLTLVTANAVGTFANKNAGTGKTVTITGITLTGTAAANYTVTQPSTTATITPKAITVTGITAANKIYNGTTAAIINTRAAVLSGVFTADRSTTTLVKTTPVGTFANANAGTGKTITVTGLSLSGANAANYTLTQPTTTARIIAKSITVTGAMASNKVYDGTTTATVNTGAATLTGVLAGDVANVTLSGATGTFSTAAVANNKTVTAAFTLGGSAGANYTAASANVKANITPKTLTIAGVTATKVYNGTTAGAKVSVTGATLTGVLAADLAKVSAVSNVSTGAFSSANAGTNLVVNVTGLKLAGASAANYTLTQPTITATITAKALTVTGVTGTNKVYDGTTAGNVTTTNAALVGVVAADKPNVILGTGSAIGTFASSNVGTKIAVDVSGLAITGSAAANYTLTQPDTTANITAKSLTITGVTAANKVYDGTTTATLGVGAAALSGVIAGDVANVTLTTALATGAFSTKNVGTGLTVTINGMVVSGTASGNYSLIQPTATANITPKAITVTGVTANDKVYDGTTAATVSATGATLAGFLAADTKITLVSTGATGTFSDASVDTDISVTVAGLTLVGTGATNYTVTQPTASADITAKALTVTGITADKEYDGTTVATLDTTGAALAGVVAADLANVTLITAGATAGAFSDANAGTQSLNVTGLTLTGTAAGNYTITQPTISAEITPKEITVTGITAADKTYNGNTAATIDTTGASLSGILIADTADVTLITAGATGTFADKNAANGKTVTIAGLSFTGDAAANYTLATTTTTADITPKAITMTGVTVADKVYDGTTAATPNSISAIVSGVLASDLPNVTFGTITGTFASADVDDDITVTVNVTLGGSAAGNYAVSPPPTTTADITPLAITATGITADKVFDGTTTATLDFSGATLSVIAADLGDVELSGTAGTFASANVGTGIVVTPTALTITGSKAANYTLTAPTITADITPIALTVSGITVGKVYDGTTTATLNLSGASLTGVLAADLANVAVTGTAGTFASANVGTGIAVTPTNLALSGSAAANYTLTLPTLTGAITPIALTVSGITADKAYDGTTTATLDLSGASLTGVLAADLVNVGITGTAGTFASANVGTDIAVTPTNLALSGSAAGNYTLTLPAITADITAIALTANGITANKIYDGNTTATLDLSGASLTGVIAADLANVSLTGTAGTFASANAGAGIAVTPTTLALAGSAAANYTLTLPAVSADIATKTLTVTGITANDKLENGNTAATLNTGAAVLVGVVAGDVANVTLDTSGAVGTFSQSTPGFDLTVTISGLTLTGSATANYSLTQPTTTADILP